MPIGLVSFIEYLIVIRHYQHHQQPIMLKQTRLHFIDIKSRYDQLRNFKSKTLSLFSIQNFVKNTRESRVEINYHSQNSGPSQPTRNLYASIEPVYGKINYWLERIDYNSFPPELLL